MNEHDLAHRLYQCLKRKRYLIILDDIWDVEAWCDLRNSFPNDENGSRILLTSQEENIASQIQPHTRPPHSLRFLTSDESVELLWKKMPFVEGSPSEVLECGKTIAERCKGLPLMIIVIAGLLSKMEPSTWGEVEKTLNKGIDQCNYTIELSNQHLPDQLKPCFLYFGAYEEDQQIPVREMLWLWIAEGFIINTGKDCIEDVAEGYMMELIQRNLVMVAGKEPGDKMKFCILHDVLRDFCRVEDFVEAMLLCLRLRTLFLDTDHKKRLPFVEPWDDILYKFFLVELRYLAFFAREDVEIPSSIERLQNLETFIVEGYQNLVVLPGTIWNMKKLRHLYKAQVYCWVLPRENPQHRPSLENLQILSPVTLDDCQELNEVIGMFPNIRELKCEVKTATWTLALDCLSQLESLSFHTLEYLDFQFRFPQNLKELTLSCRSKISAIHRLPNLEVLELLFRTFAGENWDMEEEEEEEGTIIFPNLRFLKLYWVSLARWTGESDGIFPCLEKLVFEDCHDLVELPSCLAQIPTLETIEVIRCGKAIIDSVKQIRDIQMEFGNEVKIFTQSWASEPKRLLGDESEVIQAVLTRAQMNGVKFEVPSIDGGTSKVSADAPSRRRNL
ncbi:OLC1v1038183C1 [Oldenlandia corymbosa var. corymbosa]|uniref:OLC1v1038183C1 n=1 Tax=Oldenlandia corymbosa var. corymbosa TaxID=529605 RepID=A0AAV1D0F9_OLDCO|nr:OLC1v1038183C1 [Oldenlandia corymbosa var. corymbosa]